MKDKLEGIIKKHLFKDCALKKSVQKTLMRHAENYSHIKNDEGRKREDEHAYEFVSCVYFGDVYTIEKYVRFYEKLKRNFLR